MGLFPIYGHTKVRRGDYLVFDRHHLDHLNFFEKFHCTHCESGNGLMGCRAEILARTEQYFCPITHAHEILGTHARYNRFLVSRADDERQGVDHLQRCRRQMLPTAVSLRRPSARAETGKMLSSIAWIRG